MNSPNRRPNHSHPRPASKRFPRLVFFLIGLVFTATAGAAEVQQHGLIFERWICDTFFEGYRPPSTTQKWDIPAAINRAHGAVPVNPKAAKYGAPIDLGDALRQFEINEPFILLIGCWQQEGADKRFVTFVAPRIETITMRSIARSYRDAAIAYCCGTPISSEIAARGGSLDDATKLAATAIRARFGVVDVDGKIQAHVVTVVR